MAYILESSEIKRYWPAFNYSQKRREEVYGIFTYEDRLGYQRLCIDRIRTHVHPVHTFHYLVEGHMIMKRLVAGYQLCPRLCFIRKGNEPCASETCKGACEQKENTADYNNRVREAIASLSEEPSYAILDKGLQKEDQSCILVLNGKLYGMGYIPVETQVRSVDEIKDYLKPFKENSLIRNLLLGYKAKNPGQVFNLNQSI